MTTNDEMIYILPDDSNDVPDENGQHTGTGTLHHSTKQFAIFYGCAECRATAEFEARRNKK